MRTTDDLGRWGCEHAEAQEQEPETAILARARVLFADLSRSLAFDIDRLKAVHHVETDKKRIDDLQDLITRSQKALLTVLSIEAKLMRGAEPQASSAGKIDLAQARTEIERRLDRLAG